MTLDLQSRLQGRDRLHSKSRLFISLGRQIVHRSSGRRAQTRPDLRNGLRAVDLPRRHPRSPPPDLHELTNEQVYSECDAMNCSESLPPNLNLLHTQDKTKCKHSLRSGIFEGSILHYGAFANAGLNWLNSLRWYHQYVE
jgi:hypothetical protein